MHIDLDYYPFEINLLAVTAPSLRWCWLHGSIYSSDVTSSPSLFIIF